MTPPPDFKTPSALFISVPCGFYKPLLRILETTLVLRFSRRSKAQYSSSDYYPEVLQRDITEVVLLGKGMLSGWLYNLLQK